MTIPRLIDLTLPLTPGQRGVAMEPKHTVARDGWNAATWHLFSHVGTHMDSQVHFGAGPETIGTKPLSKCLGPATVVNLAPLAPRTLLRHLATLAAILLALTPAFAAKTTVSIEGDRFLINGRPTYEGRTWKGKKIEGLMMNSRMVQGIFDDLNPDTVSRWAYPDTGKWDAERNTREFLASMPAWRGHGLLSFTINLQGGSPEGYSANQPWRNSAIAPDGSLRPDYMARLKRIVDFADDLGMIVVLGYFYFGQDQYITDEAAVIRAVDAASRWVLDHGWSHVIIEVNNECNVRYDHKILQSERVHELIERVKNTKSAAGHRLLVSTSYGGNTVPKENVVRASDYLLLHGNGVSDPKRIAELVQLTRKVAGYTPKPIFYNEDDHFNFEVPDNNFTAAIGEYCGWGYFDFRMKGEGHREGYQSIPADWTISSPRKSGFFRLLAEITGVTLSAK